MSEKNKTVKVKKCFGTTLEEIKAKKFNAFVGISQGKKYFTKDNIEAYIRWCLEHSREYSAIIIFDEINAVNYEVFNGLSKEKALKRALLKGSEYEKAAKRVIKRLPESLQDKVSVLRWQDIKDLKDFQGKKDILENEFNSNDAFKNSIIKIIKNNLGWKTEDLSAQELDLLAPYLLDEIAMLLNGIEFEDKNFDLHPYPGVGIDEFLIDLQEGLSFPELTKKLNITHKIGVVEAYVE